MLCETAVRGIRKQTFYVRGVLYLGEAGIYVPEADLRALVEFISCKLAVVQLSRFLDSN